MFSNNFVVAVKVNGKILRELQDIVYLPFGTEYTILLKNTSSQKAQVKVSIDGTDATENVHLIVDGGETFELQRFIKNGNLKAGNAFKFIEKTSKVSEYRGDKAEDGLITVTYEFERKRQPYPEYYGRMGVLCSTRSSEPAYTTTTATTAFYTNTIDDLSGSASAVNYSSQVRSKSKSFAPEEKMSAGKLELNTAGITAPGAPVEQEFRTVAGFLTDGVLHSMTLQLKGTDGNETPVVQPVVVKKVQRCTMCGTNTKQTAKFCHECGASVQIV